MIRSRRFIGAGKASQMLRQIDMNAKQEMLQFNQKMQAQADQLDNINRLAEQGLIPNPDELKARMTFGTDVARSMYPTPEKERTIPQQFGELDVYSHRISQELENFQITGVKKPSKLLAISPLATAISMLRKKKVGLQIWDPTIPTKVKGEDAMGDWRKAEPGEIARYAALVQEERAITKRKTELLGQPDITRRKAGVVRSGFDAGITESITPQRAPTAAKPKVIRQRNTRTGQERISYDGGKTWQMTG